MQFTGTFRVVECIDRALLGRYLTPYGCGHFTLVPIDRQSILEELLLILQDIFRDLSEVEIEITTLRGWIVDIRIHYPELDVFDVGCLEVALLDTSHHTTPTLFRLLQRTILVHPICIQVVGTAFVGIVGHVEHLYQIGFIVALFPIGIQLFVLDRTYIMVGQVVLRDVLGQQGGVLTGEHTIDVVPGQESTVLAVVDIVYFAGFGKQWRDSVVVGCTGQLPRIGIGQVETALGRFEIVQVGVTPRILILVVTGNQVGELSIQGDLARLGQGQQRQFVEQVGEPLAFRLVGGIQTPQGVLDRFVSHHGLGRNGHFREVHDGST